MNELAGGCLCGDVRYRVKAGPTNAWICTCGFCTGHTASPYMAMHCFTRDRFMLQSGKPSETAYRSDGSGQMIRPHFCPRCGTKVFMTLDRYPEALNVYTGTFDDPWQLPHGPESLRYNNHETAMGGTVVPADFEIFWEHYAPSSGPAPEPSLYDEPFLIDKADHHGGAHTGGCLCGNVRFEFDAEPRFVVVCHCDYCKKLLGSGVNHECLVDADQFQVTRGSPRIYRHISGASGKGVEHRFCADCGTPVFLTGERFADVGVFRGALDRPDRIELRPQNAVQIFLDNALPSGMVIAGIEAHRQHKRAPDDTYRVGKFYGQHWRVGDESREHY